MTYTPRSRVVVGCTVAGCDWRQSVSLWALGVTLAAVRVEELLATHLESGECPWNS